MIDVLAGDFEVVDDLLLIASLLGEDSCNGAVGLLETLAVSNVDRGDELLAIVGPERVIGGCAEWLKKRCQEPFPCEIPLFGS